MPRRGAEGAIVSTIAWRDRDVGSAVDAVRPRLRGPGVTGCETAAPLRAVCLHDGEMVASAAAREAPRAGRQAAEGWLRPRAAASEGCCVRRRARLPSALLVGLAVVSRCAVAVAQLPPLDIPTDLIHHASDSVRRPARSSDEGVVALESFSGTGGGDAGRAAAHHVAPLQRQQVQRDAHGDRAKQFQQEQERSRAEFERKSRAHAESIASMRADHVEAAKSKEAEARAKMAEYEQEFLERQREAEARRQEPVNPQQACATVGSIEKLSSEVAAMQSMLRGMRAELRLRFDKPLSSGRGVGGDCGESFCAEKSEVDSAHADAVDITLPLSIRCDTR